MSDVTYKEEDFTVLVETLIGITDDTSRVIIAHEHRRKDISHVFETILQKLSHIGVVEQSCTQYIIHPPNVTIEITSDMAVTHGSDFTLFRVHDYILSPSL